MSEALIRETWRHLKDKMVSLVVEHQLVWLIVVVHVVNRKDLALVWSLEGL